MATKGRKPLPDRLKAVRGEKRPSRFNPDQPVFDSEGIQCPDHLGEKQKAVWFDLVPMLIRAGVVTRVDVFALEALCEKWVEYREAQDRLNNGGQVIRTPNGHFQLSPFYTVTKQALSDFGKLMTEFGMTPSSRQRVVVETPKKISEFSDIS